ncbi:hypothetical protein ACXR6G_10460 [Ancylomarina sp. YFZ004]
MIKKTLYISAALILLLLAIKYATNDKSWVIKFYVGNGEIQSRTLIYIKGDNMKIVTNNRTYLYNYDSKTINFVNQKESSFWSGKVSNFRKAVTEFKMQNDNDFLINDVSFLRNLNSIDKNHFEEMTSRRIGKNPLIPDYSIYNNFNIKSTPNFTSIDDYAVRKYEVINEGKVMEEIWIAENILSHMGWNTNHFKDFLEAFIFHSGIAPYFNLNSYMKVRKNGLPMKVVIFHNDGETVITMDHASRTKLTKEAFSIPDNFKLTPINQMLKYN